MHSVRIQRNSCLLRTEVGVEWLESGIKEMSEVTKLFPISLKVYYIFCQKLTKLYTYHLCISLYINSTSIKNREKIN